MTVTGQGFAAREKVVIDLDSPTGPTVNTTASSSGTISVKTKVPVTTNGLHTVLAVGSSDRNTAHASYRVAASLDLSPTSVRAGGTLHTSLTGFDAHQTVTLRLRSPTGTALAQVTTGAKGPSQHQRQSADGSNSRQQPDLRRDRRRPANQRQPPDQTGHAPALRLRKERAGARRPRCAPARRRARARYLRGAHDRRGGAATQPVVHAPHLDQRDRWLANLHVCCGVGGGPFLEYPYDPPGWTPERRDFMLAEPLRIDPEGCLAAVRDARAWGWSWTKTRWPTAPGTRRHEHVARRPATRDPAAHFLELAGRGKN